MSYFASTNKSPLRRRAEWPCGLESAGLVSESLEPAGGCFINVCGLIESQHKDWGVVKSEVTVSEPVSSAIGRFE